jgi:hypothetical protein
MEQLKIIIFFKKNTNNHFQWHPKNFSQTFSFLISGLFQSFLNWDGFYKIKKTSKDHQKDLLKCQILQVESWVILDSHRRIFLSSHEIFVQKLVEMINEIIWLYKHKWLKKNQRVFTSCISMSFPWYQLRRNWSRNMMMKYQLHEINWRRR